MTHKSYVFEQCLLIDGWHPRTAVEVDEFGIVTKLTPSAPNNESDVVPGWLIPGFQNAHSHAFQYAMAGLAEHHVTAGDDFWSWRSAMYELALRLDPDQFQATATMLYAEMLYHGITHVAEFHYLHHDKDGSPYTNPAEMSLRAIAAAESVGMGITILPVLYEQGGFETPATKEQRRFLASNLDQYIEIVAGIEAACARARNANWGMAFHSLRAVKTPSIPTVLNHNADVPIHIHIAEQQKEVSECIDKLGQEPIAWLLDQAPVDDRWHLVHGTHINPSTIAPLARSGASVVICPQTEGNLGDGVFPLQAFRNAGGKVSIGTDSHIGLSPMEDLRWLDYVQRLQAEKRNIFCQRDGQDSGHEIFKETWQQGRMAGGLSPVNYFQIGEPLTGIVLDPNYPAFVGKPMERILACLIFAGDPRCFLSVITNGDAVVSGGRHHNRDRIIETYRLAFA